ncbi:hypothetical protein ACIQRW_15340 [Streptomyces sp. NPDC091287]|uniref:hypothetical protein n=1 Tax=Streptomyces sp. NPDC091287 TaxID=3365988 RepID=UPI00380A7847
MSGSDLSGLAEMLPDWHFREFHSIEVPGSPEEVMRAVHATTWAEARIARALVAITRADVSAQRRIVPEFLGGMGEVVPAGETEFLFGAIQSPYELPRPPGEISDIIRESQDPGILKIGMNVRYADGLLTTETRILATDEKTRRHFQRYWLFIQFGSGLTRTSMLRGIRRRLLRETAG